MRASSVDLSGWNEHESDRVSRVEELEGAVVMGEGGAVGVPDCGILGEGEGGG